MNSFLLQGMLTLALSCNPAVMPPSYSEIAVALDNPEHQDDKSKEKHDEKHPDKSKEGHDKSKDKHDDKSKEKHDPKPPHHG